jgi:tetratricopeptide (TPR) repeat protein
MWLVFTAALVGALPGVATAQSSDRVKLLDRKEVFGEIQVASPNEVEILDSRGETVRIPVDRIREVLLSGEPDSLRNARGMLLRQDAGAALEELAKVTQAELDGVSNLVLAEMDFVRAAALGRVAGASGDAVGMAEAEAALRGFLKSHANSFHRYEALEILSALFARAGKYDDAAAALAGLEKGPASLRVRAAVAKAKLFYEQQKYAEALREFEAAEKAQADEADLASRRQKAEASLGRARCLARTGKAADAITVATDAIRGPGAQDGDLLALAYAALGDAFRAGGKDQDAIIAFVRVDVVHNAIPDAHAEALFNLVQLWDKLKNPERSRQVRQALEATYPESRWTRLVAEGSVGK